MTYLVSPVSLVFVFAGAALEDEDDDEDDEEEELLLLLLPFDIDFMTVFIGDGIRNTFLTPFFFFVLLACTLLGFVLLFTVRRLFTTAFFMTVSASSLRGRPGPRLTDVTS